MITRVQAVATVLALIPTSGLPYLAGSGSVVKPIWRHERQRPGHLRRDSKYP